MDNSDIAQGIRKVWRYADAMGLSEAFVGPTALAPSDEFKSLALAEVNYEELYLEGLKQSQYNILLQDLSYFQFGFGQEQALRYAYYPNPFLGASTLAVSELSELRESVEEGLVEVDEYLLKISELRYSQHPPLLRYEHAPLQYVELVHPCSHLHFGHHAENRWPVRRVLTPAAFGLIVFKLHYPGFWARSERVKTGPNESTLDNLLSVSKTECRILPDELFTESEASQFFWG